MDFYHSVCALILWRSGMGLSMGKFPDDNFGKYQWIFTKNLVCVLILWRPGLDC